MGCNADYQCDRVKVYEYPAFSDSFEKVRAELEAAADSPHKGRPGAAQAVQSRKVGLWAMTRSLTVLHVPHLTQMASQSCAGVSDRVFEGMLSPCQVSHAVSVINTVRNVMQGGNKAAAGGDQMGNKKGADSNSDGRIPVKAIAEGIVTPNTGNRC